MLDDFMDSYEEKGRSLNQPKISMFGLKDFKAKLLLFLFFLFVVSTTVAILYYKEISDLKKDPQKVAEKEIKEIVEKVSRHMILPEGELPTAAVVSDPDILKKDQPFFNNAKKGDRVLIYANALKAILYNPELDKIIEVAPLNINGR